MSRKIIITFLIFFTPIAIIEQYKKDKSSEIAIEEFNSKSNFHQLNRLLENNAHLPKIFGTTFKQWA